MNNPPSKGVSGKYVVLLVTTLASFLIPLMSSAVNIALPKIGAEYNMNVIALGWVSSAYMLASASLLVPFGRIGDMYGRRRMFIYGISGFTIGSVLCTFSVSAPMLLVSRAIQGVGGSAIFANSIAILIPYFAPEERGKVLGINTASVYLGLSLGPLLGGFLTEAYSWKAVFGLTSMLCVVVIAGAFWRLRGEQVPPTSEKFDSLGAAVYSLALILTVYGVSLLPKIASLWLIGGGLAVAALFIWRMSRAQHPLLDVAMFRGNRPFTFSNLAALVNYSGTWAVSFLLSLYLQYAKKLDPEEAGLVLITSPAVQALFSPLAGRLSDRMEPRLLSSSGMALTALGIALLSSVSESTSLLYIIGCLALLGLGIAFFSSPNANAVMSSADRQHYGVASATLATMRQIGMMLSMSICWVVFALVIGRVKITEENVPGLITSARVAFLISAGLCASAIYFSMARGKIHAAAPEIAPAADGPDGKGFK